MEHIVRLRNCERCGQMRNARLSRNIIANGTSQVYWYCITGKHPIKKNGYYIPHEKIKSIHIDVNNLPVIENYSDSELCAVCQSPYAELHHTAPRHLFGDDCEAWPKYYLCPTHHAHWHKLVTPGMYDEHL